MTMRAGSGGLTAFAKDHWLLAFAPHSWPAQCLPTSQEEEQKVEAATVVYASYWVGVIHSASISVLV